MSAADRLVSLVGWEGRPDGAGWAGARPEDWVGVDRDLGSVVPPDFLELAARFPCGVFQGYLDFWPEPGNLSICVIMSWATCAAGEMACLTMMRAGKWHSRNSSGPRRAWRRRPSCQRGAARARNLREPRTGQAGAR